MRPKRIHLEMRQTLLWFDAEHERVESRVETIVGVSFYLHLQGQMTGELRQLDIISSTCCIVHAREPRGPDQQPRNRKKEHNIKKYIC